MRGKSVAAAAAMLVIALACGARTGLVAPPTSNHSNQFCVNATYESGSSDLSLYFLLDRSGSMDDLGKWTSATAALTAFVADPSESGLGAGIDFFPPLGGDACNPDTYAQPAAPIGLLPGVASSFAAVLAIASPGNGTTPLPSALRGGVEYARGVRLADPTREVAIAVITDGLPDGCDTLDEDIATHVVEQVAADAFAGSPSIQTFVIGLASGYVDKMNAMAAAGGTGKAILIDADPSTAQNIVNALNDVRDAIRKCRFAIPPVGAATLTANDLSMSYRLSPDASSVDLSLYPNASSCGSNAGFIVDDANAPKHVELCPATCALVHTNTSSHVTVTAGCGAGSPDGGAHGDGGACNNTPDISCYAACSTKAPVDPVCSFGDWICPEGSIDSVKCNCPDQPHGCCVGDGTYVAASCVNAQWTCPAGEKFFGQPGCTPPAACAPLLPCGPSTLCAVVDFSCGGSNVLGTCASVPSSCAADVSACGCDGKTYASACDALQHGVDIQDANVCSAPPNTFACGPYFCRIADELCKKTNDLTKTVAPFSYACIAAPANCSTGCGCKLCEPCPAGHSACKDSCASSGGARTLTCTEFP